jgi:limonene-1,2-epoxide hydrolase
MSTSDRDAAERSEAGTNADLVRRFIDTWATLDAARLADYFCDDGCYHNMPLEPVVGRDNIRRFIEGFLTTWTATDWQILHVAAVGNVVFVERLDRTRTQTGAVDLPCVGVFEMQAGRIRVWRDYFDMATYTRALQS